MKNWKLIPKVITINCGIAILIGLIAGFSTTRDEFGLAFGLVCLAIGLLDFLIGIGMLIGGTKELGKGFLSCAGILLLMSGISCGAGLSNLDFK